jgi:hypothetical protein
MLFFKFKIIIGKLVRGEKKFLYFWIIFFSLILSSHNNLARAQEIQPGFLISPYFQEINLQEDQTSAPFSIDVKNTTGNPAVFRVSVLDFGTLDESGGVAFLGSADNLKYSLASWVSLSNDTLVIRPGETQTVKGAIENKESLSPGGHYSAVYFKMEDNANVSDGQQDQVAFNPSFASLLFVRKVGGEIYGLNLNNKDFSKNIFILPSWIKLRFQNTGNVHVIPRGTVEITDPLGRLVMKSIVNTESSIILPETFRVFSGKFGQIAPIFVPGRYALVINYRYDGKADFVSEQMNFFLIPPIFLLTVVLLTAVVTWYIIFKNKKKKKLKGNEILEKQK